MKKIKSFIFVVTIFVTLLILVYWIDVNFFKIKVLFYSSICDGLIAALLSSCILFFGKLKLVYNCFERCLIIVMLVLCSYIFAISIPTVIDRSLSFYILEKIQQRGGGIREDRMEDVFVHEYVKEHHLVDIRLTEQMQSGTIVINNGCVMLTDKGDRIAQLSRFFRANFLPKHRLLMNNYSDALVDPFKNNDFKPNYQCE